MRGDCKRDRESSSGDGRDPHHRLEVALRLRSKPANPKAANAKPRTTAAAAAAGKRLKRRVSSQSMGARMSADVAA